MVKHCFFGKNVTDFNSSRVRASSSVITLAISGDFRMLDYTHTHTHTHTQEKHLVQIMFANSPVIWLIDGLVNLESFSKWKHEIEDIWRPSS